MKNKFGYFFKEASKNVFSNGWMSLASIFTVIVCLLVFGVFMVLSMNLNYIAAQLEGDYEIILIVDETYDQQQLNDLYVQIKSTENVDQVNLSSKAERLEKWKQELENGSAVLDGYENDNPLRDWFKITLLNLTQSDETVKQIEQIPGIVKIIRNEGTINKLVTMTGYLKKISIWIMAGLALISVFIIANTIKLTVFARRKEINIMKFVGATDWFIRWPFIFEGIIIGFLGSAFSFLIVVFGYDGLLIFFKGFDLPFLKFIAVKEIVCFMAVSFAGLGILLGGIGSLIAVRKHLKV